MILRYNDWAYHPEAAYNLNTANQSFLKLAYTHQMLGVSHWYCSLALHDLSLLEINPRDPTLDFESKARVGYEMLTNPWYFYREVGRVPQDGGDHTEFGIHRGSFTLVWVFFNNIDIALLLIRQQGKTVVLAETIMYLKRILRNSRTILLTRGSDLRAETISKMKAMRDALPQYLWQTSKDDADNTEAFTYNARGNKLITCIAQNSAEAALNAGRGLTTARLLSDETAFTKFIRIMLPAALGAATTARRIAEQEGIPYGNIFTTTPGKRDEPDGKFVYDMFHGGYFWDEKLMDIETREQLISLIDTNSDGDRTLIHAPFNHRQLGMTDLELYKAMANAGGTHEEQLRDFGLQWTAGSLSSPLTVQEAEMIREGMTMPLHLEICKDNYIIKWYYKEGEIQERMKIKHIAGLDTSEAVQRDAISMVLISSETLEVAATSVINESNLVTYANWLGDTLIRYENIILVIERKSTGPTMIDSLLLKLPANGIDPCRRIYNTVIQNREEGDSDLLLFQKGRTVKDPKFYDSYRKYFGFQTNSASRDMLYSDCLKNAVKMAGTMIRDRSLSSELLALVVKNDRIDHRSGNHDDCVIAWLMACWFMLYGKRLDYYGVSNRILMKRQWAGATSEDFDKEAIIREDEEQKVIIAEIDGLCTQLCNCKNPFVKSNLDRKLKLLLGKLVMDTSMASTVTELQEMLRNEKLKARYL